MSAPLGPPMTLWRMEVARLVRTRRWVLLAGVYGVFGIVGPLTARYIDEIIQRFGGGIEIVVPDPTPVDGIVQFVSNAGQLGVLAVVVVASAALSTDSRPELAAFLRTRVPRGSALLPAPYLVTTAASALALVLGTALAWVLTTLLIGPLPAGGILLGTALGVLYLAFTVAVVALVAGFVRSQVTTVFATVGVLLVLPLLAVLAPLRPWLPSELLGAVADLAGGGDTGGVWRAAIVTVVTTVALLVLAARRRDRREL